jgi:hypothetical protein
MERTASLVLSTPPTRPSLAGSLDGGGVPAIGKGAALSPSRVANDQLRKPTTMAALLQSTMRRCTALRDARFRSEGSHGNFGFGSARILPS